MIAKYNWVGTTTSSTNYTIDTAGLRAVDIPIGGTFKDCNIHKNYTIIAVEVPIDSVLPMDDPDSRCPRCLYGARRYSASNSMLVCSKTRNVFAPNGWVLYDTACHPDHRSDRKAIIFKKIRARNNFI